MLLSFGFVIPNDLVDVAVQGRCRRMYAVQITDGLLDVVVHAGTVARKKTK